MRGGLVARLAGFWIEQAHPDEEPVVIDAVDDISVQLELGNDRGRECDPAGVQFRKRDRLIAGLAQSLEQALLLNVSGRHRPDCRPFRETEDVHGRCEAALLALDVGDWDLLGD